MTDDRRHPTADEPLNAPRKRPLAGPILAVIALFVVIAGVFVLISYLAQNAN